MADKNMIARGRRVKPIGERLMEKIALAPTGCWNWTGATNNAGYGTIFVEYADRRRIIKLTHRVSYEITVGPIPAGQQIDHLCRNRLCVNPAHLEAVTQAENIRRGMSGGVLQTHCKHGHTRTPENIGLRPDGKYTYRVCKVCERAKGAAKRRKRGARKRIFKSGPTTIL